MCIFAADERQADGKYVRKQIEIDFVCNRSDERIYVQSAFSIPTTEKRLQEERPEFMMDERSVEE